MYIFIKRHTQLNVHVHFDTDQNRCLIERCVMTSDNQLRQCSLHSLEKCWVTKMKFWMDADSYLCFNTFIMFIINVIFQ